MRETHSNGRDLPRDIGRLSQPFILYNHKVSEQAPKKRRNISLLERRTSIHLERRVVMPESLARNTNKGNFLKALTMVVVGLQTGDRMRGEEGRIRVIPHTRNMNLRGFM